MEAFRLESAQESAQGTRNHIQALPRPQQGYLRQPGAIQRGLSEEGTRVGEENENKAAK